MQERMSSAMRKAVFETIENMAFLEVRESHAVPVPGRGDVLRASLLMHDPVQGEFRLLMPRDLLLGIAEVLFAISRDELTEQLANDALLEILNTVAGQFLNELIPGEIYRLGLPEIVTGQDKPLGNCEAVWHFRVEESGFSIAVSGTSSLAAGRTCHKEKLKERVG